MKPYYEEPGITIYCGDSRNILKTLPDNSVDCCVTSPPFYGLRDYKCANQIGLEKSPHEYVKEIVAVFSEVRRILKPSGTCWIELGDSYAGSWGNYGGQNRSAGKQGQIVSGSRVENESWNDRTKFRPPGANGFESIKPKDLIGIPWMVAFALRDDGWWLRSDIVWAKPNCMPESVLDRPTRSHSNIFLLTKSARYFYDSDAIKEPCVYDIEKRIGQPNFDNQSGGQKDPKNGNRSHRKVLENLKLKADKQRGHSRRHDGFNDRWDNMEKSEQCTGMRNKRDVWTVAPANYPEAHFATWPPDLVKPMILAGCPVGGIVLDPFLGSGTSAMVALELGRKAIGVELNPDYIELAKQRCSVTPGLQLA